MDKTKNRPFPQSLLTLPVQLFVSIVMPVFFAIFVSLYKPFGLDTFLDMGKGLFLSNVLIMSVICLVVLALIRAAFWNVKEKLPANWSFYSAWCLMEIVMMSLFCALFLTLVSKGTCTFFKAEMKCLLSLSGILVYPYVIISLLAPLSADDILKLRNPLSADLGPVKFYDENHRLKMVLDPADILYIRAEENYVRVNYVENERRKDFSLRASMLSLEEELTSRGIVRCHRSFYVNPAFIKELKKGKEGSFLAELKMERLDSIPVSKKYYEAVSELL